MRGLSLAQHGTPWRHTTPRDLTFALALAVAGAAETVLVTTAEYPWMRALVAVVAASSLAVRRRHALGSAVVVATGLIAESVFLESPDEVAVLLTVVVASFSLAAYGPVRDLVVGGVLLSTAVSVSVVLDPSDTPENLLPTWLLFVLVPAVLGLSLGRRQRTIDRLTEERHRLEAEAASAVEGERRRIARELHDVVSHAVTVIAVQAEAGQANPVAAPRALAAIGDVSRDALGELHRMLAVLGPEGDGDGHLEAGPDRLETLLAGARSAGLDVRLVGEVHRELPLEVAQCAYRVVQEGLTNALRHSAGSAVEVRLALTKGALEVAVDSTGARHSSGYGGSGRGLAGIRERVTSLGGTVEAAPHRDGFLIAATIPVRP